MKQFAQSALIFLAVLFTASYSCNAQTGITCPNNAAHCAIGTWQPSPIGDPATGYNVYRTTTNGGCATLTATTCTKIASTTAAGYTDSPLAASTSYYYVITGTNSDGESNGSPQSGPWTTGQPVVPGPPGSIVFQIK